MSARKITNAELLQALSIQSQTTRLDLPAREVRIHRNGIEFRTADPIPVWTEMTVALELPEEAKKLQCTGVIVACTGNRHLGYTISMVFTSVSPHAQERLKALAFSPLA